MGSLMLIRYGEVVDVNLVRDKGFAFVAYEDQRSTNLAVGMSLSLSLLFFKFQPYKEFLVLDLSFL